MSISLRELSERINSSMPVGTIIAYYGTDQPDGWLICDGRSCSGTDLSGKLGINNVPDLRGRFIRMIGGNAAGMAVAQEQEIQKHKHFGDTAGMVQHGGNSIGGAGVGTMWAGSGSVYNDGYTGGVETRPVNMAFNFIIKAMGNAKSLYYKLLVYNILYRLIAHIIHSFNFWLKEVRFMSISLNNHENRIRALENKSGSRWQSIMDESFSGSAVIPDGNWVKLGSYNANEYPIGMIGISFSNDDLSNFTYLIPLGGHETIFTVWGARMDSLSSEAIIVRVSPDAVYARTVAPVLHYDNIIRFLWGLKIYYIFRYNIQFEFIRSINYMIGKITHSFTSLFLS